MTRIADKRLVDLTRVLRPGSEPFKLEVRTFFVDELLPGFHRQPGQWYVMQEWEMSSHIGTHVEAPLHHVRDGIDVSRLDLRQTMGEAVVLDFSSSKAGEAIKLEDVRSAGCGIRSRDIVLIHTGFDEFYGCPNYNRPYLTLDAIQWLADQSISCLGIDASGIEKYKAEEQPGHLLLFGRGIPIIEELTHLDQLTRDRVFFLALPLPIRGADSCPVRAIAFEDA